MAHSAFRLLVSLLLLCVFICGTDAVRLVTPTTFRVLHFGDAHLDLDYKAGSPAHCLFHTHLGYPCCHELNVPLPPFRQAGSMGDYWCDTPVSLLEATFRWMNLSFTADPKSRPDFAIFGGDMASHHHLDQSPAKNLRTIQLFTDLYAKYLPDLPLLPMLGNHDTWPCNQLTDQSKWLFEGVGNMWHRFLTEDAYATFMKGGYYSMEVAPKLRVVALNTLFYDPQNLLDRWEKRGDAGQWDWFVDTLAKSQKDGERVWVTGHVMPGNGESTDAFSEVYQRLMTTPGYSQMVSGHLFAHVHQDLLAILRAPQNSSLPFGMPIGLALTTPAIQPDDSSYSGFHILQYDASYTITHFESWASDLDAANRGEAVSYHFQSSFQDMFHLPAFDPLLVDRLLVAAETDESLLRQLVAWSNPHACVNPQSKLCFSGKPSDRWDYLCDSYYSTPSLRTACKKTHSITQLLTNAAVLREALQFTSVPKTATVERILAREL